MFIDIVPNRKSAPAVLLRESYREGGRVKKRTLANLSKLPQALIDAIEGLLDGGRVMGKRAAEPSFEIVRSLPHGHVAAVQAMIRKLGLERMLQGRTGVDKRVRNLIEAMIIQRIIAPGSKLAFHRALAPETATSSLALSVGRCCRARGVRRARLADRAANAHRGGAGQEAAATKLDI